MKTETPLVDKDYLLLKTEGKGAWTFVEIPEIPMPKTSFGMLKVKGKIDDYAFSNTHLMPIGNGHVGLAVRAEIRKNIKKQAGDIVHITIYENKTSLIIPQELVREELPRVHKQHYPSLKRWNLLKRGVISYFAIIPDR